MSSVKIIKPFVLRLSSLKYLRVFKIIGRFNIAYFIIAVILHNTITPRYAL